MKYIVKRKGLLKLITSRNKYLCTDGDGNDICVIHQTGKITRKFGFDVFSTNGNQLYRITQTEKSNNGKYSNWSFDITDENEELIGAVSRLYKPKFVSLLAGSKELLSIIKDLTVSGLIDGVQNTISGSIADMIHGETIGWYFDTNMGEKPQIFILPKKKKIGAKLMNLMVSNSGLEFLLIINKVTVSTIKGILNPAKSKLEFVVPDDYTW